MKFFGRLSVTMALFFAGLLLQVIAPSSASAVCDIVNPIQSGGATSTQSTIFGASAQVTYQNPVVCNQPGRQSSAWVMVSAPNDGSPNGAHNWYFQLGYKKLAGGSPVRWAQWTKSCYPDCGSSATHGNWYGAALTGTHTYAVYLVGSTQRLRGTIDGAAIADGPTYDPSLYWDSAWAANFAGETHDKDSNIPGIATNKVVFTDIKRYNGDGTITFVGQFESSGVNCACPGFNYQSFSPGTGSLGFRVWTG